MSESYRHHGHGIGDAGHPGFDPDRLAEMEQRRREMLPPEELLPQFLASTDLTLLDMGCGVGFFSIPAARFLSHGKVLAVDLQQGMIDATTRRARESGISNLEGIVAPATQVPLPDSSVDVVLMSMVFHDIDAKTEALKEIARLLRPKGSLFIIEMDRGNGGFGPPMEIRITPDTLKDMLVSAGFTLSSVTRSSRDNDLYFAHAEAPSFV